MQWMSFLKSAITVIFFTTIMWPGLNAQQQLRITPKGQIEPVNTGLSVFIGQDAGDNDDLTANQNVFIGFECGRFNTTGYSQTAIGAGALRANTTGYFNCAIGYETLNSNTDGTRNAAFGNNSLMSNTIGDENTALGHSALESNFSGNQNTGLGAYALFGSRGHFNTAVGRSALQDNYDGQGNVAVGYYAHEQCYNGQHNVAVGMYSLRNTVGNFNTAIGSNSGSSDSTSSGNVYIGYHAGTKIAATTNKNNNVIIGYQAGYNSTGDRNVFLGYSAGKNATGSDKLYIENSENASPLIYGDFATNKLEFNGLVEVKAAQNIPALIWDNGGGILKNNTDAMLWDRPVYKMLLDADNNDTGVSGEARFQLFSNVDSSAALTAKISLNCDGGDSWINSGDVGIGITNPVYKMDVAGVINGSSGLSGPNTALRAQGAEAIWFDGTQFSWGFGGTWNRFADSVRIGTNVSPSHMLQVDGIARSSQSTWATTSDARVKENVVTIEHALETISRFRPVTFEWIETYRDEHPEAKEFNYGFISQEVEQIIPSMVSIVKEKIGDLTIDDFRVLNSDALVPLLVGAVQEQQAIIEELRSRELAYQARFAAIEQRLASLESSVVSKD